MASTQCEKKVRSTTREIFLDWEKRTWRIRQKCPFPLTISKQSIKRQKWNKRIMLIVTGIMITMNCFLEILMREDRHTLLVEISVRKCHFCKILPAFMRNQTLTGRMSFFSSNSDFKILLTNLRLYLNVVLNSQ